MKKKFAFLLMGAHYTPEVHQACFETEGQVTRILTVRDAEEARVLMPRLREEGFGAVELCGAFGPELAGELAALIGNQVAVGYITHDPGQDHLFQAFFSDFG